MIKSIALIAVFLGAVPFLLGLLYTNFVQEEKNNLLMHLAAGYVMMFGVFELIALPLIWLGQSLSLLVVIYFGILAVISAVSLFLNYRRLSQVMFHVVSAVRQFTLVLWGQTALVAAQVMVYVRYQYANADDAFFVASATTSLATNTIFAYNPYTGTAYTELPSRYVLSPFYAFTAAISRVTDTHPAIIAHSVFMILFLLLAYAVYALIARALFSCDMERVGYFMILLSALNIFSAYSERTSGLFLLIRLWQGKAVLAGILLPMILYLAIRLFQKKEQKADWLLLFLLMCACCMVSSMGVILGAISIGIFGILIAWKRRSARILLSAAACCLPNMFCAAIYLMIH